MTFKTMQQHFSKPVNDITRLIRGKNIGGRGEFSNAEVWQDLYTQSDLILLEKFLNYTKEDYIRDIREYLEEHPFCTAQDITDFTARPASYTWWILTEMSDSESDLAETDDDELFLVSEKTIEMLDERGDLW